MANSAARIAEIRAALSSTGKSVSDYSARFAAGEVRTAALFGVRRWSASDSWRLPLRRRRRSKRWRRARRS